MSDENNKRDWRRRMIITVPVWGDEYSKLFLGPVLKSHRAALKELDLEFGGMIDVRYVVPTDRPAEIAEALGDLDLTLVPIPSKALYTFRTLCDGHRRGIEVAREGDRVVLLCADMLLSRDVFAAVERRFRKGKKAIVSGGLRTVLDRFDPYPPPMRARKLSSWAWDHRHPITKNFVWGKGKTTYPCVVFFENGANVVMRGFHLHPLAVIKDRPLPFSGSIDLNLMDQYRFDEIHLVTDVDELATAEISHKSKTHNSGDEIFDTNQITAWAIRGGLPMHWWNFRHRIIVRGDGTDQGDSEVAEEVLRLCPYSAAKGAAL